MGLSVKISSWAWDNGPSKASSKLLLLALADHSNDDGLCYPSLLRLEKMTGINARYLRRIRDELIETGYISVIEKGSGRKSSVYRVNYDGDFSEPTTSTDIAGGGSIDPPREGPEVHPKPELEGGSIGPPRVDPEAHSGRVYTPTQGGSIRPPNHNRTVIEPSVEPLREKNDSQEKKTRRRTARDDLWDALVDFFGDPSTTTSKSMYGKAVKELFEIGATPEEVTKRCKEAGKRWSYSFSPIALLKHWDNLAVEQNVDQKELKGNAQLGKNFLGFEFEGEEDLVEKLGGKVYRED